MAAEYQRIRADPSSRPWCSAIRAVVARHAPALAPVTAAVCLGIGSFDPADGAWEAKRRSYVQLLGLAVMLDELEKTHGRRIRCTFQEPVFTAADVEFLTSLGHVVVEAPAACEALTPDSLLYGIHLYRSLYAEALQVALPAVYVGTGWDVWDQMLPGVDDGLQGIETMHKTYHKAPFPQEGTAFSSTCLYWRRD
ncbi:uncharacterized protein UV8b_05506 [Ustilaginoidea virens]|uniref:SRR1-like domain-containing protein n=1 Tax=Ustilaginoidea virens TaxID=1159556 RepID=A0A1B5L1C5_USTVR|nr:uncharacterized protein UV8b_05506 [Ustilaginoidea virens]QUC21263.1 hypothetical protein UV8b_05506 [Ustilaginoidea virens]GAO17240.1 hypothetical protein UVI_02057260 [Ustilaginoidea virens]